MQLLKKRKQHQLRMNQTSQLLIFVCLGTCFGTIVRRLFQVEEQVLTTSSGATTSRNNYHRSWVNESLPPSSQSEENKMTATRTTAPTTMQGTFGNLGFLSTAVHRKKLIHSADIVHDDLLVGKSCLRSMYNAHWDCRDCGENLLHVSRDLCPPLLRNNICKDMNFRDWDTPPRQQTFHDTTSDTTSHQHLVTHFGTSEKYEQIQCESLDVCFNMTKCKTTAKAPMKLYAHGSDTSLANELVTKVVEHYPTLWERTLDPMDACLLVVTCDSYPNVSQFLNKFHYDGKNHFVWDAPACFGSHADMPFNSKINYKYAALATSTMTDSNIRRGYDIPVTRIRGDARLEFGTPILPNTDESRSEPRKYLLSFKANIFPWPQVWWQHRWLATEYWTTDDADVLVDTKCEYSGGKSNYSLHPSTFGPMLLQSTFAFAPGGGSVGSFRFAEILALGGIPMVVSDFVPPMWPELDWSGCILRVSEARIVNVPEILRNVTKDEISSRRQRCMILFQKTIGWKQVNNSWWNIDSGERTFLTSMRIWHFRIQDFFTKQEQQVAVEAELISEA